MNYYRRFPGDYSRDTQHLTTLEHGIYNLLLDHLYSTEKPIATLEDAYRIAHISNPVGRTLCKRVVSMFFLERENGYWHKRVEEELKYAESRSKMAKHSAEMRWKKDANAMRTHSDGNALQTPDTRYQTAEKEGVRARELGSTEFERFWTLYPRKIHRTRAVSEWCKQFLDNCTLKVLDSLARWKACDQWKDPQFIPHPGKWLAEQWKYEPVKGNNNGQAKSFEQIRNEGTDAAIRRVLERGKSDAEEGSKKLPATTGRSNIIDIPGTPTRYPH